jgi:16S rRNA (uracil1498-N3)-methyltransferase
VSETPRFYSPALPEQGGRVELDAAAARHAHVLRLDRGARVRLFDGRGREADAVIDSVGPDLLACEASVPSVAASGEPRVVLVQVVPKGKKLDGIVRMATELGVAEIRLASARRSEKTLRSTERLERIAREAARQSRRATVPLIAPPLPLLEVAREAPPKSLKIAAWEGVRSAPLPSSPDGDGAWVVVGAEGGLEDDEVRALDALGYAAVGLGPTILRVETAVPVALALVLDRLRAR